MERIPDRSWSASSVMAGAYDAGWDGSGTANNASIPGDSPNIVSKIASIVIAGDIAGTDMAGDHFGFVAQQIGSFKFGTTALRLHAAGAPDVFDSIGITGDTSLREIAVQGNAER